MTRRAWLAALAGASPALLAMARQPAVRPASSVTDATTLSIAELGEALAAGRLTPIDITAAYLARIDRENPALNAFITVARGRAFDDTRRVMTQLSAGAVRGPLMGVPIAHKDLLATRGVRTTGGSKLHEEWVPDADATVVARLANAGAILLGKTNTHELGGGVTTINPFFGTTHNPHDQSRIAGGSSGGSAAAVAARLALVATGSDTGGSVRIPAALCGCLGLKPTFGLIGTTGVLGACPTFDHVGVLARTAADAALVLGVMAGRDSADANSMVAPPTDYGAALTRGVTGRRIGVPRAYFFDSLEPGVARAVDSTLRRLEAQGARLRDVTLPIAASLYDAMFAPIAVSEIRATYAADWRARPEAFSPEFAAVFAGTGPSEAEVARAREARLAFERHVNLLFDQVDVLAMPTVPQVAPRIAGAIDGMRILRNTWAFNASRSPALSVPCGTGDAGLPVGLQLVGRRFDEATLLGVAAAVERG